jgi:hypothetical protein
MPLTVEDRSKRSTIYGIAGTEGTGPHLVELPVSSKDVVVVTPALPSSFSWVLRDDAKPVIAPNSEILLFVHGMDSRAEEADDITKALFMATATTPTSPPTPSPNPTDSVLILNQILQKYKSCILEKYETQQDMLNRGLPADSSGLTSTTGLQARDTVTCVAGNDCSLADRTAGFAALQTQANNGDAANFEMNLERIIPKDCFNCVKHAEWHTKHVHCTMEVGGNSGVIKGPEFEACKAGVDIEALATLVKQDISGIISGIINNPSPVPDVTGGATIATNHTTVHFTSCPNPATGCPEMCDHPDFFSDGKRYAVVPFDTVNGKMIPLYFVPPLPPVSLGIPPAMLVDSPLPSGAIFNVPAAHNIGANEGRILDELRQAAAKAEPLESLRKAALKFATGLAEDADMGKAYADLSVTGRRSFAAFRKALPQDDFCQSLSHEPVPSLSPNQVLRGCRMALDRAYRVANFLRTGQRGDTPALKAAKIAERNALGWIAVSGEDDAPHRPVNVPSSDFPQYDQPVVVETPLGPNKSVTVWTRYTIAQSKSAATGKNLVIISFDLPTSGYADNLDYRVVSPLSAIGNPKWTPLPIPIAVPDGIQYVVPGLPPGLPPVLPPGFLIPPGTPLPDFQATDVTPVLDFIEAFIVHFAETLDQKVAIKSNIKAVMGGSLGGNMTFRLGRRPGVPWLPKFVVWSPASIWDSLGAGPDLFKHYGVRTAWENADKAINTPGSGDRAAFFGSWDQPIVPLIIPMAQSDTWTSDYYPCKESSIAGARLDRQETYDAHFFAWHWRLGAEQLLFSHQNIDPGTHKPLYMLNQKPMLLGCGLEDHVPYNDICPATQKTAQSMTATPGKALFLDKTGHSLDNERRGYWAQQIITFLGL